MQIERRSTRKSERNSTHGSMSVTSAMPASACATPAPAWPPPTTTTRGGEAMLLLFEATGATTAAAGETEGASLNDEREEEEERSVAGVEKRAKERKRECYSFCFVLSIFTLLSQKTRKKRKRKKERAEEERAFPSPLSLLITSTATTQHSTDQPCASTRAKPTRSRRRAPPWPRAEREPR